ncbi:SGNH/GDSL hydrolase family protein [soil metagenome]
MKRRAPAKRLDQLDENFQAKSVGDELRWFDAFHRGIALRGLGWPQENFQKKHFRRLPDRATAKLSEGVQVLSHCPASVFLSFSTSSPIISVRMTLADPEQMNHMPATGMSGVELYFREGSRWIAAATATPPVHEKFTTQSLIKDGPSRSREYRLYLPLYKRLERIEIGLAPTAKPKAIPARHRPIVFYGTSITQGGCANTAGGDFVSQLGRQLEIEMINLGFSGNGKGEPEIARLISQIDARAFVVDYAANADVELLQRTLPNLIDIVRKKHPSTPIILMSCVPFNQSLWDRKSFRILEQKRDIMLAEYLRARQAGDERLHFIDGHALLPCGESGIFVDGVHPTSQGFGILAERLGPQLSRILSWE